MLSRETDLAEVRTHLPPRSPDLTPLHFYLWGYMKDYIGRKKIPAIICHMKDKVKEIIESILQCVIGEFSRRIRNSVVA